MNKCRSCGCTTLYMFLDLGHMPPSNSFLKPEQLDLPEVSYPLKVYFCPQCTLVQIDEIVPAEEIFAGSYPYFSSDSPSNISHAREFVDSAFIHGLPTNGKVLEIGSNDGYMLKIFADRGCNVTGVDPAIGPADMAIRNGLHTITDFFTESLAEQLVAMEGEKDLVCGINVFAHQPDLNDFVAGMKKMIKWGGMIAMEFPHLLRLMEGCQFDTIYHEHYNYFSVMALSRLFARHGLEIFDIEETPVHGGSIRVYAQNSGRVTHAISSSVAHILRREEEMLLGTPSTYFYFSRRVRKIASDLLEFVLGGPYDQKVFAYGAAAKGNTLLNYCGIKPYFIQYAVDRSPHKQGLFLPGSHIEIVEEEMIEHYQPDYVLITAWNLADEIMEQLKYIKMWGGRFVIPIPELKVI